jgi:hypothetical protein
MTNPTRSPRRMPVVSGDAEAGTSKGRPEHRVGRLTRALQDAASGAVSGSAALAVAELVSAAVRPEASPVTVVGGAAVDRTPPALKDFAVRHFGTEDKTLLQLGIVVVLALFAVAVGVLATRHRRTGAGVALVFGAVGVAAAPTRPDARPTDVLPSASQLGGGTFTTLEKGQAMTSGSDQTFEVNDSANIVCGNVQTSNATYIVDRVLMPKM